VERVASDAIRVSERVYWVGAIDSELRDFHGYLTSEGSTYNAYLILADQVTLVDTVKAPFREEMMKRISSVVDPTQITRIISNHAELDHSGAIPQVMADVRPTEIIASANGAKALQQHFHWDERVRVVADQERLDIGGAHVQFIEAKMLYARGGEVLRQHTASILPARGQVAEEDGRPRSRGENHRNGSWPYLAERPRTDSAALRRLGKAAVLQKGRDRL